MCGKGGGGGYQPGIYMPLKTPLSGFHVVLFSRTKS